MHAAVLSKEQYDAVLATSANAFLQPLFCFHRLLTLPLYCVGQRTAQAAYKHHFTSIIIVAKNVDELCIEIGKRKKRHKHFIYLAGRKRRPVLENFCKKLGVRIDSLEVYDTEILAPSSIQKKGFPKTIDFVLLYSSANLACFLEACTNFVMLETKILCLSPRIAKSVSHAFGCQQLFSADEPTEKALFSLLDLSRKRS
jgi:uroporphyrinogen-III synthase